VDACGDRVGTQVAGEQHDTLDPLAVEDIDELTDRLLALLTLVVEFGNLALGRPMFRAGGGVSTREYGVGDVLVVRPGQQDQPAAVVREGKHAEVVHPVVYTA
jgi:hypothetical protein